MSSVESNSALAIADKSLRASVRRIKLLEADGRVAIDQAHEIARVVSKALQQHGRNASVISPFLLSVAAEVRATMNEGLKPQWDRVRDEDPHMESHPFFPKTVGYVQASQPAPAPAPYVSPVPAAEVMSVPPIDLLPPSGHQKTDKGKLADRGTRRPREDSPGAQSGRKKRKVSKPLSKAIASDTEDEHWQPGGAIVVKKASNIAEPAPAAPPKSKGTTKGIKKSSALNHSQKDAEDLIGRPSAKGKGKEKAEEVAKPVRGHQLAKADAETYNPPCGRCVDEPCRVLIGRRGQVMKSCQKCHTMKASMPRPRSKAAPASKSKVSSRTTRATSHARPPTPVKDTTDEANIELNANAEQHTDVETEVPAEEKMVVDEPRAIASADDFPADHWAEPHSDGIPTPLATTVPLPPASLPPTVSTIHERVLALTAQVAAMQLADQNMLARANAMEQDFDTRISSMHAELSSMQLDVGATVTLVDGLVCLVEKLQQDHVVPNPSFPAPVIGPANASTATAMGYRYLNGHHVHIWTSVFGISTRGPSNTVPSPASATHSLP
ncbi:hypothetical protein DFH29DRAFT_881371 [Suillus ampliporus]|nr:hypothetical protein DFH29DRAFT_881371 [Suillus ampliporus]